MASLETIAQEAATDLEVIVVDGGSGPDILRVAGEFPWANIISEPDNGIYDAMNKGLDRSQGSFIWFLNGGDECSLSSWQVIREPLECLPQAVIFAAYHLRIGPRSIRRLPRKPGYMWHGLPTSHQAIFYPGEKAREVRYDERFSMVGDYHFTARMLGIGLPVRLIDLAVASFYMDGVSFKHSHRVALEAAVVQRETLKSPAVLRYVSRVRHSISRNVRRFQSDMWR
ncbi:glycosyltransferase [Micrococcaceae bacterium Sec5.7]